MKYFTLDEFLQSDTATKNGINMMPPPERVKCLNDLVAHVLDPLREALGKPITVTSGYRPEALNKLIGGVNSSQHTLGQAADIRVAGMTPKQLCQFIIDHKLPFDQLIQEFGSWTHVSYGPRNRREVLTAKTVNGKTVYTPGI